MASKQCASTRVKIDSVHFEWKIERFSLQTQQRDDSINSPLFYSGKNEEAWQVRAVSNGESYLIFLHLKATANPKVEGSFILSVINPLTKSTLFKFTKTHRLGREGSFLLSDYCLTRSLLLENSHYLMNDTLTICVEILITRNVTMTTAMSTIEAQLSSVSIEHNIQHDIEELFTECDDGDVSIVVGDEKLRAHKVILTARSPVFNAMFANKTTLESQKNEVNIEDLTSDVVRHILKYIYTDKIDDEAPIFDLFGAAEKYQLKGLKAKCAALIASNLHSQNAIDSLFYANLYGPKELKEFIIDYICVHDLDVEASTDFIKLAESSKTWSDLLVEVYVAQISKRRNKEE